MSKATHVPNRRLRGGVLPSLERVFVHRFTWVAVCKLQKLLLCIVIFGKRWHVMANVNETKNNSETNTTHTHKIITNTNDNDNEQMTNDVNFNDGDTDNGLLLSPES